MKKSSELLLFLLLLSSTSQAAEVTVKNDSLTDNSTGAIQAGFVATEQAASWLQAPCDGNIVAAQVLWRSQSGTAAEVIHDSIQISEAGVFPIPGVLLDEIVGPVLTDGVINEYRFKDENNVIPLIVPVIQGETYVIALKYLENPPPTGPSVVNDTDGCQAGKNGIHALLPPLTWFSSCLLGVSGDFVIRTVIDCSAPINTLDLSVQINSASKVYIPGSNLDFNINVSNAGPTTANATTLIDFFPAELTNISWVCTGTGASCPFTNGNGNITESISLAANQSLSYAVSSIVNVNAIGPISDTAQVVVPNGLIDTNTNNNSVTFTWVTEDDLIYSNGFETTE